MSRPTPPLRARLHWLQLGSSDAGSLARFYALVFGMQVEQRGSTWICGGPNRCLIFSPGTPKTLISAGYAVTEPSMLADLQARTAQSHVALTDLEGSMFEPGAFAVADPDGNRMVYGLAHVVPHNPEAPPARLQHLVVGSTDIERMVGFYTNVVGLTESDRVLDENGVMRTCFMRSDDEHHSLAVFTTPQNRLDHHCYELPDWNSIRDWGDRLASYRIPIKWGPGRHGPGNNLFVFFHDPDGNWVELSAELEIVGQNRPAGVWPHEERTLNSWGRGLLRS